MSISFCQYNCIKEGTSSCTKLTLNNPPTLYKFIWGVISYIWEIKKKKNYSRKSNFLQDVGQAVLEGYSRVLEGLAFNIVAWVEDVLFVDRSVRNQDQ